MEATSSRAEAVAWPPSLLSRACRDAQSHSTRPEEAQGPKGRGRLTVPPHAPRDCQLVNMLEASVDKWDDAMRRSYA